MTGSSATSAARGEGSGARLNGGGLPPAGGLYQRLSEHDGVEPGGIAWGGGARGLSPIQVHMFGGKEKELRAQVE